METNIHYAAVGAFMLALIAALTIAIIWLSSGFSFQAYSIYQINMQESVTGLNIDSPVEFNGVVVGSVKSIDLDHTNPQLVEVLLNIKSLTPITQGTIAVLQTRGVTGVTFIALKDKSENLIPLKAKKGDLYPIITTGPSIFMRLDTALSQLSDNLKEVTISIRELLSKDNQRNIREILLNVQHVTGTLADNNERMNRIILNTEKATQQFMPLIRTTSDALRMFQTQTLPATYQLVTNLDTITRSLTEVSAELRENPSMLIRGVERQPNGPGEKR